MAKFPVDAPRDRVLRAFERLGFHLIRGPVLELPPLEIHSMLVLE